MNGPEPQEAGLPPATRRSSDPGPERRRSWFRRPAFLLGLVALLAALLVEPGEVGSIDTILRLQTTHSLWTSAPPLAPEHETEYGVVGRGGRYFSWFGIGQSVLMVPADILDAWLCTFPAFKAASERNGKPGEITVSFLTSPLICVLGVLAAYGLLRQLGFRVNEATAGALALLFGTTFLHYTQNMMENNLILLLDLTGLSLQYRWLREGRVAALAWGSAAYGANLLTRLTTGLDLAAGVGFILLCLWLKGVRGRDLRGRVIAYLRTVVPVVAVFVALDRLYHWYRFGAVLETYTGRYARQLSLRVPNLPPNFPFNGSFWDGSLGPLFSLEKSIFLIEPLVGLTLLLMAWRWARLSPAVKAYLVAGIALLAAYIGFYATYFVWSGDFAWGDRYITSPVQLLAMMAVPIFLRHRAELGRSLRRAGQVVIACAVMTQLASVFFWHPLEIYQMETLGHPTFVVGLRVRNIAAWALGASERWGLVNALTLESGAYSTTPYCFPFLAQAKGVTGGALARALIAAWFVILASLATLLLFIRNRALAGRLGPATREIAPPSSAPLRRAQPRNGD